MQWCVILLLMAVALLIINIVLLVLNYNNSNFTMEERIMNPLTRFSGFTKDFPSDNLDSLGTRYAEDIDVKNVKDEFIYNGGYLEQNLQMEHFDSSDYYNYDPVDNGGVDYNTIDSHMKFADKVSKEHNKNRESNHEFQETPYVKQDLRASYRPSL
jgi:hypothetical protein